MDLPNPGIELGDPGLIPGWERSTEKGNGNPLQYSCLENPRDRGTWWATVHGILQARILEWVAFPFSRGSFQPSNRTQSPTFQVDSLPVKPQGKSKNTGVGSSSLLQWIFLTQKLNQGLLHCRWILCQLSYQEAP